MSCSFRVADKRERNNDFAGEVNFSYTTASAFDDWLYKQCGLRDDLAPDERRDLMHFLDDDHEKKEYTREFVRQIARRWPDPDATPFPGITRVFLEAAFKGVGVHHYL
jgi:hypothetical protein